MTRYPAAFVLNNPAMPWIRLALKTSEMMMASAQVIQHRTGRLVTAGTSPSARDRREFRLMGQEKIEAATESLQAIASRLIEMNTQLAAIAFRQGLRGANVAVTLLATPAFALSAKGQGSLLRDAIRNSAKLASQMSGSMARVTHYGLMPIHSRATGNAKRLLKRGSGT